MDDLESSADVLDWLQRNKGVSWIAASSLHLRAFYWGLYCGMGLEEPEEARNTVAVRMYADTMWAQPADDPFKMTEVYSHVEGIRKQLEQAIVRAERRREIMSKAATADSTEDGPKGFESIELLFKPLRDSVERLEEELTFHRNLVHRELEPLAHCSANEALRILETIEGSLRVLTTGEQHGV